MFTLDVDVTEIKATMFTEGTDVVAHIEIWHKHLGHVNVQRLKSIQNQNIATGIPKFKVDGMQDVCEARQLGKQSKSAFPHDKHVRKNVLDVVHLDVWDHAETTAMGGCRYYVTCIDDHTRKVRVYFMKEKSEVLTHFQSFKAMAKKQIGKYVKCLRSDGGGKYFSKEFNNFLNSQGI